MKIKQVTTEANIAPQILKDPKMTKMLNIALRHDTSLPMSQVSRLGPRPTDKQIVEFWADMVDRSLADTIYGNLARLNKFEPWLLKLYINGVVDYEGINGEGGDTLGAWNALSVRGLLKPQHQDFNKFQSIDQLTRALRDYSEILAKIKDQAALEKHKRDRREIVLIDNKRFYVAIPLNYGSCYTFNNAVGVQANFCTGGSSGLMWFKQYSVEGPIIIVFDKANPDKDHGKWQMHTATDQLVDAKQTMRYNLPYNAKRFTSLFPGLLEEIMSVISARAEEIHEASKAIVKDGYDISKEIARLSIVNSHKEDQSGGNVAESRDAERLYQQNLIREVKTRLADIIEDQSRRYIQGTFGSDEQGYINIKSQNRDGVTVYYNTATGRYKIVSADRKRVLYTMDEQDVDSLVQSLIPTKKSRMAEGSLNEFAPDTGGEDERSRKIRKLLEIAIKVAKEKNVKELSMVHAMNVIAGDDFFRTAVEGILPDITDHEYMFVIQTAYKTVKHLVGEQGVAENFHDGKKPGRKGLAQALTQSLIKQELQESISRTVYHYTGLIPAFKILQSGEFQLSGALGSVEQQYAPKGYPYFFSTTRTRRGGYHDMVGKGGVLFVLDGNWFNQRYPGAPIDYFLNRSPTATHRPHEAEDRVFSRDATIPINGVRAIHVYVSPVAEPEQRATARQLMILAKRAGIPVSLYRNAEAWRNFDSRNTADVGQLRGQERTGGRISTHPGYLLPWIQLLTARDKSQLNKDADKIRYSLAYTYNREDAARGLSTDLSNARKPNSGPDREHAVKIIQFMRKNNLDTVKDLIAVLAQKWQLQDKKVEENFAIGKKPGRKSVAEGTGNTVDFPIANVRRPNGAIGTQGVTTDQVAGVLKNVTGLDVSPDMSMKELVDTLRGNVQAQQQLRQFTKQNPVKIQELPDGTYHIQDGHHRTFLLNLLGDKTVPALVNGGQQGVAEGKVINTYLWHGSRQKIPILEPRQAVDTGGAAGSNQNAIYATSDPIFATQMGMPAAGSDYGHFPNDPQMVLFSGKIRKGEYVYLHKLPFNGPDGKPQFVRGGNNREFHSIPGVEGIKPIEIKKIPVNKYLNLIRKATPADWKLRKKYMKQGVAEDFTDDVDNIYAMHPQPEKSEKIAFLILDKDEIEFATDWRELPDPYQQEFGYDLPLWNADDFGSYPNLVVKRITFDQYVNLVGNYIKSEEQADTLMSKMKRGVAEGSLNEFDPTGYSDRYKLYMDSHYVETFADLNDAIAHARDLMLDDERTRDSIWTIKDANRAVIWSQGPGDAYDQQRRDKKIKFFPPDDKGVTEGSRKIKLSTDSNWYGAEVGNYRATGPVKNITLDKLEGFEPDKKMESSDSQKKIENLIDAIQTGQTIPPILVRKYKFGYQIIDGHHRFHAYKMLNKNTIPAQIVPDEDIEEISKKDQGQKNES